MNFLFDEQMSPRLARALEMLGEPVRHVQDVVGKGAPDDVVLKYAASRGYCLISMDRKIRARPHEKVIYLEAGVGIYFIKAGKKHKTDAWELIRIVFKHWKAIRSDASKHKPPFMRLVTIQGIKRYH